MMYIKREKERRRGFTLIELLVVIAIIGLLSSVVLASLNSARGKARDARRQVDLKQVRNALEFYFDQNNMYPGNSGTYYWISDNNYEGTTGYPPCGTTGGLIPWIPSVCSFKDPQGNPYGYTVKPGNQAYSLGAKFELSQNQGAQFYTGAGAPVGGYFEPK